MSFFKRLFGITRYYLVSYKYGCADGTTGFGHMSITSEGGYVNHEYVTKLCENYTVNDTCETKIRNVVIINIIEISRLDNKDFFYKEVIEDKD